MMTPSLPPIIDLDSVDGTNAEAKRRLATAAADGTVVTARIQTAGVGRRGRTWTSPPGNLYWSVLHYPTPDWPPVWGLSIVAALAVLDLARQHLPDGVTVGLKWPNDVLVSGAKVAGILLESGEADAKPWVITGIGVNLISAPTGGLVYAATSLQAEGAVDVDRDRAVTALTTAFADRLDGYRAGGLAWARAAMLADLVGVGELIVARLSDDPAQDVSGILRGLDAQGRALIDTGPDGVQAISAGDLFFARPASRRR